MRNVSIGVICAVLLSVGLSGLISIAADYTPASSESAVTLSGVVVLSNAAVSMTALPTATTGLATGRLWDSSGTVKVVQ
jgi:hypothetical protein